MVQVARAIEAAAAWVGGVSWQAGLLIALVLVVRWGMGRRLSAGWRCALWVLVGMRLVVPGVVGVGEIARLFGVGGGATSVALSPRTDATAQSGHAGWTVTVRTFWDASVLGRGVSEVDKGEHGLQTRTTRWGEVLGWAWAGGVAVMVGRLAGSNWRLARRVRGMKRVEDAGVLRVVRDCAGEMRVRRNVTVVETGEVRSPAVCGVWRAVVMLPVGNGPRAGRLNGEDLRMVLLHEMAHVRRGDVLVEWVAGLLRAVHWFNPLVWAAAAACRADRELACDEAVLRRVGAESRTEYGACLLRVVEAVGGMRPHPAAVGVFGRKGNLRRRIDMIAAYRGRRSAAWSVAGLAAFVAVGCAAATGGKDGKVEEAAKSQAATEVAPAGKGAGQAPAPAVAENSDEERPRSAADRATLAALEKRLPELRLDAVPFSDVVDYLRDATGVNVFVNWRALEAAGIERNTPVTTRLRDVRAGKALETVLRDVGGGTVKLGYEVDDGVVTVTTAEDLARNTVTRVYDVRDLIVDIPDFLGRDVQPVGLQERRVPGTAVAAPRPPEPTRQDRVAQIVGLLQDTVDPESWRDKGGTVGSIREISGQLVVTQTPENQKQIAGLLVQLHECRGLQVAVETRYLVVDPKVLAGVGIDPAFLKAPSPEQPGHRNDHVYGSFLSDEKVAALLKLTQGSKGGATLLTAPRMIMFNGQRARVTAGEPVEYTSDYVLVMGKDGERRYEPVKSTVTSGVETDIQPTASADRKYVVTNLESTMTKVVRMKEYAFSSAGGGGENLPVREPVLDSSGLQTCVSIPVGQTALLGGHSVTAVGGVGTEVGKPGDQVLILVKPTLIVQELDAAKAFPIRSVRQK